MLIKDLQSVKYMPFGFKVFNSFLRMIFIYVRRKVGIVLRKVGIPTLSADSGIVPDNARIAQGIYIVLSSDMTCAQSRNRVRQSRNTNTKGSANREYSDKVRLTKDCLIKNKLYRNRKRNLIVRKKERFLNLEQL